MMLRCTRPFREVACFDPITLVAVAATTAAVGSATSAAGSILSGQAAAGAANANAINAQTQATLAKAQGEANASVIGDQGDFNAAETLRRSEFNAQQSDRAARDARTDLVLREGQTRLAGALALGDQRARIGASGVTFEGSPLEVLAFQAWQNELDALTVRMQGNAKVADLTADAEAQRTSGAADAAAIRYDAAQRSIATRYGAQVTATGYQSQVGIYKAQAASALTAGYIGAASSVLDGASKATSIYGGVRR